MSLRLLPLATAATLAAPGGAAALGAQPAPGATQSAADPLPPVIEACYVPASGTVYRIKAPSTPGACLSAAHVAFTWNQQGVRGEKGDKGDRGDAGPPGTATIGPNRT
jgi:hypothetical protein